MRVYVEGYGCSQNLGEAEALREATRASGHTLVQRPQDAELGVLVTCAVIGPTEDRMVRRWQEMSPLWRHTVVTGCMVPLRKERFVGPLARGSPPHFLSIRDQTRFPQVLAELAGLEAPRSPPQAPAAPPGANPGGSSPPRHVWGEVTLTQGCTSHCTYCFSRLARGPLRSVPLDQIRTSVERALGQGAREIRLTSLDTSCYGMDMGGPEAPRLPEVVRMLGRLGCPEEFRIRVGMMSPQTLRTIADEYLPLFRSEPRLFRFLHLPVQSGSDGVLGSMRRGYTVSEFRQLILRGREIAPDLTVSTDVITGFPGESEEDHQATLRLLRDVEPEIVNVTRFSPRPLTPAARLSPVPARVAKERSREIARLRHDVARRRLERYIGSRWDCLVVEEGVGETRVGRLDNYLPVVLPQEAPIGQWARIQVHGVRTTYLLGDFLGPTQRPLPASPGEVETP